MRAHLVPGLVLLLPLLASCGASTPASDAASAPSSSGTAASSAAATTTEPAKPVLSAAEQAAWKAGEDKLAAAAKKAGETCGTSLAVELSTEQWAGKILESSGPEALAGGGMDQCLAGLDAIEDVCKKNDSYKKAFAGWIKVYGCWPAKLGSVGTSNNNFEVAFHLPGRTPAENRAIAADSLQRSLEATGAK